MFDINIYARLRPLLYLLDPELVLDQMIRLMERGIGPRLSGNDDPALRVNVFGLDFPNPVCLAAGFDKHAQAMQGPMNLGFGGLELGTVTPMPQAASAKKPRIYLINDAKSVFHRFDMGSIGLDAFVENLEKWHNRIDRLQRPVGINLGTNKDTADPIKDIAEGMAKVAHYANYITVQVPSSGVADVMPYRTFLTEYLDKVMEARRQKAPLVPIAIKISPDIREDEQQEVANAALESGVQSIIVGGTTASRPSNVPRNLAEMEGGVSGGPVFSLSTRVLANIYKFTEGKIPLIGCGGVYNGETAYAKIKAGASLVQLHAALIFEGPRVVRRISRELAALLERDGYDSVAAAVGTAAAAPTKLEEA